MSLKTRDGWGDMKITKNKLERYGGAVKNEFMRGRVIKRQWSMSLSEVELLWCFGK